MGCDIHFHVEKQGPEGWTRAEPLVKNRYQFSDSDPELVPADFYGGRNYSLFAMLADVRNRYGFAGVDRGDRVTPISEPRGLPSDVSAALQESSDDWGSDGHSHSWFTTRELLAVDWFDNKIVHRGWVGPEEFDRWRKWGKPDSWSGGVSGGRVEHVSNEQMATFIDELRVRTLWNSREFDQSNSVKMTGSLYTKVEWTESWADAVGEFMGTLVRMAHVAVSEGLTLDQVRAVFWFDN